MPAAKARRSRPAIRFRLTLAGWLFLGAMLLVGMVAVNSGLALLYVLFGCMVAALHMSAVLSRMMVAAVQAHRDLPPRCRQNEPVRMSYQLRSMRGGGSCLALRMDERAEGHAALPPAACTHLPARQSASAHASFTPRRRGRVRLAGFDLTTSFPFGLLVARRRFAQAASLLVWPARGRLVGPLLGGRAAQSSTSAPSPVAGGQDEFYGLRDYRPGDNPRWIHWRRSAGRGEPVIRELARPRLETVWVVLDTLLADAAPQTRARRERAIRFAATLIEEALSAGYRVGAAMACASGPVIIAPDGRAAPRQRLLDALAEIDENRAVGLGETATALAARRISDARVFVVGGADGEAPARLRQACRHVVVLRAGALADVFQDDPLAAAEGD